MKTNQLRETKPDTSATGRENASEIGAVNKPFQKLIRIVQAAAIATIVLLAAYFSAEALDWSPTQNWSVAFTLVEWLAIFAIVQALAFDFVNGFHDTAHAVATIIYSGALRPWVAILMSATLNCLGALLVGTTVALFITSVIPLEATSLPVIISVLMSGLVWNLVTWYRGMPVSSSHCLIGSLLGAGIASAGLSGLNWTAVTKAMIALIVSPTIGFLVALAVAWALKKVLEHLNGEYTGIEAYGDNGLASRILPLAQILSSASVSFSHGSNDGQKTMGIITLILATQFSAYGYGTSHVPEWVVLCSAIALGLGTAIGGWRIIRTVGEKLSHKPIDPVHGCAAEFTTAATVFAASHFGVPVSTTHTLTSAVIGATAGLHGREQINIKTIKSIGLAWIFTFPVTAFMAAGFYLLSQLWI